MAEALWPWAQDTSLTESRSTNGKGTRTPDGAKRGSRAEEAPASHRGVHLCCAQKCNLSANQKAEATPKALQLVRERSARTKHKGLGGQRPRTNSLRAWLLIALDPLNKAAALCASPVPTSVKAELASGARATIMKPRRAREPSLTRTWHRTFSWNLPKSPLSQELQLRREDTGGGGLGESAACQGHNAGDRRSGRGPPGLADGHEPPSHS